MPINIINKRDQNFEESRLNVYCGRGSPLGNPFIIGKHGTRTEVIEEYRTHFEANKFGFYGEEQLNHIKKIYVNHGQVNLVCWCAPKACHCDVIKEHIEKELKEDGQWRN